MAQPPTFAIETCMVVGVRVLEQLGMWGMISSSKWPGFPKQPPKTNMTGWRIHHEWTCILENGECPNASFQGCILRQSKMIFIHQNYFLSTWNSKSTRALFDFASAFCYWIDSDHVSNNLLVLHSVMSLLHMLLAKPCFSDSFGGCVCSVNSMSRWRFMNMPTRIVPMPTWIFEVVVLLMAEILQQWIW